MERQLRRIKNNCHAKPPKTCNEINSLLDSEEMMEKYGNNLSGTDRFYVGGEDDFCLFASKKSIELVEENIAPSQRKYLMDATFKIVPNGRFRQLLIIHIQWNQNVKHSFHNSNICFCSLVRPSVCSNFCDSFFRRFRYFLHSWHRKKHAVTLPCSTTSRAM